MALNFNADNDRVDYLTDTALDNVTQGGWIIWFRPTDDTARQSICLKQGNTVTAVGSFGINWRADQAGDFLDCFRQRTLTTTLVASANIGNFSAYALNTWLCLAFVFDTGGANSDQRIYLGSRSVPMAEPSSYITQDVSTGTPTSESNGVTRVGNGEVLSRELKGNVGMFAVFNGLPTVGELNCWKNRPRNTNKIQIMGVPGIYGTGTQVDLTGGGKTGTITGATLATPAPLGAFFG